MASREVEKQQTNIKSGYANASFNINEISLTARAQGREVSPGASRLSLKNPLTFITLTMG
jgi:hypothetical protein